MCSFLYVYFPVYSLPFTSFCFLIIPSLIYLYSHFLAYLDHARPQILNVYAIIQYTQTRAAPLIRSLGTVP